MTEHDYPQQCDQSAIRESPCHHSMRWQLAQVTRLLDAKHQAALSRHDLDFRGYIILIRLQNAPCSSQLALGEEVGIDKSTLVAILDHLESRGWIERIPAPNDRRTRIVRATEAGQAKIAAAHGCIQAGEEELLTSLSPDARKLFLACLATLASRT